MDVDLLIRRWVASQPPSTGDDKRDGHLYRLYEAMNIMKNQGYVPKNPNDLDGPWIKKATMK